MARFNQHIGFAMVMMGWRLSRAAMRNLGMLLWLPAASPARRMDHTTWIRLRTMMDWNGHQRRCFTAMGDIGIPESMHAATILQS
ncbi:predicted protein [Lichtheimia corymbifera JMRC:FSU:9682]|uniref:Secreted protein n=1 Tax=Lichtheimia corymbifera JMRC:FSU:9682 TaxID=1263082 RepID=A0A068RGJ5_9FUNG|nr:predicted protein [Lichtheimia corymbifera JMRC:FSU:9682]